MAQNKLGIDTTDMKELTAERSLLEIPHLE